MNFAKILNFTSNYMPAKDLLEETFKTTASNYNFKYINKENIQEIIETVLKKKQKLREAELEAKYIKAKELCCASGQNLTSRVEQIVEESIDDESTKEYPINESFEMFVDDTYDADEVDDADDGEPMISSKSSGSDISTHTARYIEQTTVCENEQARVHRKRKHCDIELPLNSSNASETHTLGSTSTKELKKVSNDGNFSSSSQMEFNFSKRPFIEVCKTSGINRSENSITPKIESPQELKTIEKPFKTTDPVLMTLNDQITQTQQKLLDTIEVISIILHAAQCLEKQTIVKSSKNQFNKFLLTLSPFLNRLDRRLMEVTTMTNCTDLPNAEYQKYVLSQVGALYEVIANKCTAYSIHLKTYNVNEPAPPKLNETLLCIERLTKFYINAFNNQADDVSVAHCLFVKVKNLMCRLRIMDCRAKLSKYPTGKAVQFENNQNGQMSTLNVTQKTKPEKIKDGLSMYAATTYTAAKLVKKAKTTVSRKTKAKRKAKEGIQNSNKMVKKTNPPKANENAGKAFVSQNSKKLTVSKKKQDLEVQYERNTLELQKAKHCRENPSKSAAETTKRNPKTEFVTKNDLFNVLKPFVATFIIDKRFNLESEFPGNLKENRLNEKSAILPLAENEPSAAVDCTSEPSYNARQANLEIQDKVVAFAKNVQYRHIISHHEAEHSGASHLTTDEIIDERNSFVTEMHKSPLYKNRKFRKPWKVMSRIADSIANQLIRNAQNEVLSGKI